MLRKLQLIPVFFNQFKVFILTPVLIPSCLAKKLFWFML